MENAERANLPDQLHDLAQYVRDEINGVKDKELARKQLNEFLINIFRDEENRKSVLEIESSRNEIITLLTRYDAAEQAEAERFVTKFQMIEQVLIMVAALIEKGRQGVDF